MARRTTERDRTTNPTPPKPLETRSACTVVEGKRERRVHATAEVPVGIEKLLYLAATDGTFRRRLLEDRAGALDAARVRLTPVERATLQAVPERTLETMIARLRPAQHGKRRVMRAVAATLSLAAGVAVGGCVEGDDDGDAVDTAPIDIYENYADGGIDPGETYDPDWTPPDAGE